MARKRSPITAGIYAIRNQRTGAVYVGSSRNVRQRWMMHRSALRHGRHSTKALQAAWIEDGPNAFEWDLIEEMPLPLTAAELNAAEEAWHKRMAANGAQLYAKIFRPRIEDPDSIGKPPSIVLTIRIPRDLFVWLKASAGQTGISFNDYVVMVMRRSAELAERGEHPKP